MHPKYKRMIYHLKAKGQPPARTNDRWFLYILQCCNGSFYTGITKNIEKRLRMHNAGKASRYTRSKLPVTLLYKEYCGSHMAALIRECEVKSFPRKRKEKLIQSSIRTQMKKRS